MRVDVVLRYVGVVMIFIALFMLLSAGISYVSGMDSAFYPLLLSSLLTALLGAFPLIFVERTEQMFEQQKQFIGNASHEIQTPLAICRNRLEMLMEDDSLSEKQLEELMKTHQTLEYITKLNKSLLLLSKIDNGQFTDTKELELNVLLKQYLQDYEEVYDYRNIEVTIDEQGVFKVTMNESLAVALLTNLLKNAFVHNIDGGHIRITVTKNGITFRNSGVEHPLNKEHIFERFYQGSKKEGSTGLGLAIADSICRLQHLNIKYYFEQNEHCFEISQS